ncbi:MAG: mechanosensitive ion channel family protein [Propionibacteriaceae bacterium]|nr:mechanosensitive ion channel family protein [Propionibacteriaceae bacterium]
MKIDWELVDWKLYEIPLKILAVIVLSVILRAVILVLVTRATKRAARKAKERNKGTSSNPRLLALVTPEVSERHQQRTAALASLFRSMTTFVIFVVAVVIIIDTLGISIAPIIAATGVGGVALGFGAQSLVKDFLSGISIIVEDQYGVGDLIDTGDVSGIVEEISLRSTRLRDASGQIWYIRNGEILKVGNVSQGWSTATIEVPLDPYADSAKAIEVLTKVAAELDEDPDFQKLLLDAPQVAGVSSVTGQAMKILVTARTASNQHLAVQRELLARGVEALREAGIAGPIVPGIDPGVVG